MGGARPAADRLLLTSQVAARWCCWWGGSAGRTLGRLRHSDKGFSEQPLLVAELATRSAGIHGPEAVSFREELLSGYSGAGVQAASLAEHGPLTGSNRNMLHRGAGARIESVHWEVVTPGFFATVGIPCWAGAAFTGGPRGRAPRGGGQRDLGPRFFADAGAGAAVGVRFRFDPVRDERWGDAGWRWSAWCERPGPRT